MVHLVVGHHSVISSFCDVSDGFQLAEVSSVSVTIQDRMEGDQSRVELEEKRRSNEDGR